MCDRIQSNETLVYHSQDLKPKTKDLRTGFPIEPVGRATELRGERTAHPDLSRHAHHGAVLPFKIWFQRDHGQPAFGGTALTKKFQSPEMPPSLG